MTVPPSNVCQFVFALHVFLGRPDWEEQTRAQLLQLLFENGLSWNDLPAVLADVNTSSATMPLPELLTQRGLAWIDMPEVFKAINATAGKTPRKFAAFRKLNQSWGQFGNDNANIAAPARKAFDARLIKYKLDWTAWTTILIAGVPPPAAAAPPPPQEPPQFNVLDVLLRLLEMYWATTAANRMVVALYAIFTHLVFKYFSITPRLALLSPLEVSGKTLLLKMLELLSFRPFRSDNITAAAFYRQLYVGGEQTMELDEGDNLDWFKDKVLRATANSGYDIGGRVTRTIDGRPRNFSTFGPLVIAAIGKLPLPLLSRCVAALTLLRPTPDERRQLQRFDLRDPGVLAQFRAARELIEQYAATCVISPDPPIPDELQLRNRDNWAPFLAIADSLGYGEAARAAAIELCGSRAGDNPTVRALMTIRTAFEMRNTDRFYSDALVEEMIALDDYWLSWYGPEGKWRQSRRLNQAGLADMLRPLVIRTQSIWPVPRNPDSKSKRGYYERQFQETWDRYCPATDTPAQTSKIISFLRPPADTSGDTAPDTDSDAGRKTGSDSN